MTMNAGLIQALITTGSALLVAAILAAVRAIVRNTSQLKENTRVVATILRELEDGKVLDQKLVNDVDDLKQWRLNHEAAHTSGSGGRTTV